MSNKQPVAWKKRVLIPFWIVRILLMLFIIAAYAWAINYLRKDPNWSSPALGVIIVFMLLIVAVLLMDILSILLFLRDALYPKTFLILNAVQTAFWTGVLILDIAAIARGNSAVGLGFTIFVLFTFVGLLIYAIRGYMHQKKQSRLGHYAPAHNPAMPAAGAYPPAYVNAAPYQQQTGYGVPPPPNSGFGHVEQHGANADYYGSQPEYKPAQPAHMV